MPSRSVFVVDWALNLPCIVLYCIAIGSRTREILNVLNGNRGRNNVHHVGY